MSPQRRAYAFVVGGVVLLVLALVDPLEGSIITVPGVGAVALGTFLAHSRFRSLAYSAAALLFLGVAILWIMSAFGGIGGDTGRSMWWGLLLLPYPIGWMLGLFAGIRVLRDRVRPAET